MSNVRVFLAKEFDPWLNLATEDWLFRDMDPSHNVLFLWRNSPTVVIGRYQNPWQECDLAKMEEDDVKLARRQSGGGAVFHDMGNTNFTFMSSRESYSKERNNSIIISALARMGITAEASGRNDLIIEQRKFSGSAFKLSKDRAFHHGTILINADITRLGRYLTPDADKLQSKGIKSVSSRVANLSEFNRSISHETLCPIIIEEFFNTYGETCEITELSHATISAIPHLKSYYEKMVDWDWRFGKTPQFACEAARRFSWGKLSFHIDARQGVIQEMAIFSDALVPDLISAVMSRMEGVRFTESAMTSALSQLAADMPGHAEKLEEISAFLVSAITFS
jgi:lipoate---protein ligase